MDNIPLQYQDSQNRTAFSLLCSLFFLWAVANNLNDVLLPQFQQAFDLNNFQAGLIQSAFYFGYFFIPIPAGILMKKLSYKAGILAGLLVYATGALLFWPAAEMMSYKFFLLGLFVIAAGLGCLETAANPLVTILGSEKTSDFRLNLAQSFNSLGAMVAVIFGQKLILSKVPHIPKEILDSMAPKQLYTYNHKLVLSVQMPYVVIASVVIFISFLVFITYFPEAKYNSKELKISFLSSLKRLLKFTHWKWAVLAQFCYVGAQTACWSYLIRYAIEEIPNTTASSAADYLFYTMIWFFIGRLLGTWLIRRFEPRKILAIYSLFSMLTCLFSSLMGGYMGLLALTICSLFMSVQYPTIFSLGIKSLGKDTKYGSSVIVMTIIGGGIVTPIMGTVIDISGKITTAELVPAFCFCVIFIFSCFRSQVK